MLRKCPVPFTCGAIHFCQTAAHNDPAGATHQRGQLRQQAIHCIELAVWPQLIRHRFRLHNHARYPELGCQAFSAGPVGFQRKQTCLCTQAVYYILPFFSLPGIGRTEG